MGIGLILANKAIFMAILNTNKKYEKAIFETKD